MGGHENTDTAKVTGRFLSLDYLRGLAVLGMALSGMVPFTILPAWMYHAQVPPPEHKFNPAIPGITWVDLVFPFFLFSLGAAIPIAMRNRNRATLEEVGSLVIRFLLIAFFAIYLQNTKPTGPEWSQGLLPLLSMAPLYLRPPSKWPVIPLRVAGLLGVGLWIWFNPFDFAKNDIILLVLANVALFGGVIYLATRENRLARALFLCVWTALVIARLEPGWVKEVFRWNEPLKWVYNAEFLKYLLIVIPGMYAGEALLGRTCNDEVSKMDEWIHFAVAMILVALVVSGLYLRMVFPVVVAALIGTLILWNWSKRVGDTERQLVALGSVLLLIGLCFEPFQGGIKKDSATLSYFFVTSGLASYVLAGLNPIIRREGIIVRVGQNAILAYIAITHIMPFIWKGLGIEGQLVQWWGTGPWAGMIRATLEVALLAFLVSLATRVRIVFRA